MKRRDSIEKEGEIEDQKEGEEDQRQGEDVVKKEDL